MSIIDPVFNIAFQHMLRQDKIEILVVECCSKHVPGETHVPSKTTEYNVSRGDILRLPHNVAEEIKKAFCFQQSKYTLEQVGSTLIAKMQD